MDPYFWPSLLLILGLLLVVLEVFVPSGGVLSVLAGCGVVASIALAFAEGFVAGSVMLLIATVLIPVVIASAVKWWPHTPLGRLVLAKRPDSENEVLPDTDAYHRDAMVGKDGAAVTDLLPSGDVRIEGKVYDAVSVGMPINRGQAVRVVDVNTQRIVVRPLDDSEIARREGEDDVLSTPIDSLGIEPFDDPMA